MIIGIIGGIIFSIGTFGLIAGVPFFETWYYVFAWWGYIFLADGYVARAGRASLIRSPGFLSLCFGSAVLWFFFEAANLRIENWWYLGVPHARLSRWLGYWLSFATVLPGLIVTERLLEHFRVGRRVGLQDPVKNTRTIGRGTRCSTWLFGLGWAMLVLPLMWPVYFFPLVWGALFFLVEPVLIWRGWPGLLTQWQKGQWAQTVRILLAGLVCGGLWEFWNNWAAAKWIYTVPGMGKWKIFEMPVLGFLGFPPFALECYSIRQYASRTWRSVSTFRKAVFCLLGLALGLLMCWAIDHHTVRSFQT